MPAARIRLTTIEPAATICQFGIVKDDISVSLVPFLLCSEINAALHADASLGELEHAL
jgi:hypothetical protein